MVIVKEITDLSRKTAIALGFFDGVHLAHKEVIGRVVEAKQRGLIPTVLTFSVQNSRPQNKLEMKTILTDEQKILEFERLNVEQVITPCFEDISNITPLEFFREILIKKLKAEEISCGYDYTFGKKAEGNIKLLSELCEKYGIKLSILEKLEKDGECLSSTLIRKYIEDGDMVKAGNLLGYKYYTLGKVLHGKKIGNTIGFPTINQILLESQVIPKHGVYKTTTYLNGDEYKSITNIGVKPTIAGDRKPSAETYIIGFSGDIYGKTVRVSYDSMLRNEKKFSSIEELKFAIAQDVNAR